MLFCSFARKSNRNCADPEFKIYDFRLLFSILFSSFRGLHVCLHQCVSKRLSSRHYARKEKVWLVLFNWSLEVILCVAPQVSFKLNCRHSCNIKRMKGTEKLDKNLQIMYVAVLEMLHLHSSKLEGKRTPPPPPNLSTRPTV